MTETGCGGDARRVRPVSAAPAGGKTLPGIETDPTLPRVDKRGTNYLAAIDAPGNHRRPFALRLEHYHRRADQMMQGPCSRALLPRCRVREPFNGLSHLAGALLSLAGLLFLAALSVGKPWHLTGFAVYGGSLVLLYLASTLYHSLPLTPRREERLLAFDQVAIYMLIAGTYTPICLVPLRGPWGWSLLGVVWGIALVGIVMRLAWRAAPEWVPVALYLVMGWLCVVALKPLGGVLPGAGMRWLFAGGIVYTVGAAVFASQRPRLWPGKFSSHELWHVFVLGGSACHFVVMLCFVAPMR